MWSREAILAVGRWLTIIGAGVFFVLAIVALFVSPDQFIVLSTSGLSFLTLLWMLRILVEPKSWTGARLLALSIFAVLSVALVWFAVFFG